MVLAAGILASTLLLAGPERAAVPEGSRAVSVEHSRPVPRLLGGIGLVLRDRYLLLIALLVVLLNWINSTGEFILADFIKADAEARVAASAGALDLGTLITAFYGQFQFWVTLVSLCIQLFLVSRIFRVVGVRGALLIHPIIVAIGYGVLALGPLLGGFVPIFTLIRWIKIAENSVDYSLMNTTRQALFLPVDRDAKYDGKTAIDTFFWRFGDLIQAVAVYVGLNHLHWSASQFAVLNLLLALGLDRARARDRARLQPEGARERDERGAGARRSDTGPAVLARAVVPASRLADGVPRRRPRRRADLARLLRRRRAAAAVAAVR